MTLQSYTCRHAGTQKKVTHVPHHTHTHTHAHAHARSSLSLTSSGSRLVARNSSWGWHRHLPTCRGFQSWCHACRSWNSARYNQGHLQEPPKHEKCQKKKEEKIKKTKTCGSVGVGVEAVVVAIHVQQHRVHRYAPAKMNMMFGFAAAVAACAQASVSSRDIASVEQ